MAGRSVRPRVIADDIADDVTGDVDDAWRPARPFRFGTGVLVAVDATVALLYALLLPTTAMAPLFAQRAFHPVWLALLLAAGASLPLAVRRLWPRTVFVVVVVSSFALLWLTPRYEVLLGPAFALYLVAVTVPRRRSEPTLAIGAASAVGVVVLASMGSPHTQADTVAMVVLGVLLMGGAWAIGRAVQERRLYASHLAEQRAAQAVSEERLRIARELHDIVAHGMSLIAVKAGIANHVLAERPEEAHDALRVIETTSREALIELRHLLGVLRSNQSGNDPANDLTNLGPQPNLAQLPELVTRAAQAGVEVTLDVPDDLTLPDGVALTVFRIVQEAVTNVVKHAAPARCQVTIRVADGEVHVDVTDDGGGRRPDSRPWSTPPSGVGHGLLGMRERIALYGGTLSAGPRPDGGFAVSARLPYEPTVPAGRGTS